MEHRGRSMGLRLTLRGALAYALAHARPPRTQLLVAALSPLCFFLQLGCPLPVLQNVVTKKAALAWFVRIVPVGPACSQKAGQGGQQTGHGFSSWTPGARCAAPQEPPCSQLLISWCLLPWH